MSDTTIIEPSDVIRVLSAGTIETLPDGTRRLSLMLVLHPLCTVTLAEAVRLGSIERTFILEPPPEPLPVTALVPPVEVSDAPADYRNIPIA